MYGSYQGEAIEWRVLDKKGDKVLLLSEYGLDIQPFDTSDVSRVLWKDSTMRKWLNNDFYEITGGILQVRQEIRYLFEVHFRAAGYRVSSFAKLEDPEDILNCGIEIKVQPPGKALKIITLLSGGEKAFVAIALYFAILKVRPTPFVVMDEIEAALDDANVVRFARYMRQMADKTQFIVITHRRGTMEEADVLYGVTMQEQGVSRILTINLNDVEKELHIK